jgi:hypothetical protein
MQRKFSSSHSAFKAMLLVSIMLVLSPLGASAQLFGPPSPSSAVVPKSSSDSKDNFKSSVQRLFSKSSGSDTTKPAETKPLGGSSSPILSRPADPRPMEPKPMDPVVSAPKRPPLLAAPGNPETVITPMQVSRENPPLRGPKLDNPSNALGLSYARNQLSRCSLLVDKKLSSDAMECLVPVRQWLVDATEAHIALFKALSNVSSARGQSELEKQLGLEFAMLRDQTFFQMARVYMDTKENRKAVKELVEVIKSQPRSEIGLKAYDMLQLMGFTEKLQIAE